LQDAAIVQYITNEVSTEWCDVINKIIIINYSNL
jgi:hypothetical protein